MKNRTSNKSDFFLKVKTKALRNEFWRNFSDCGAIASGSGGGCGGTDNSSGLWKKLFVFSLSILCA